MSPFRTRRADPNCGSEISEHIIVSLDCRAGTGRSLERRYAGGKVGSVLGSAGGGKGGGGLSIESALLL